MSRHLPNSDRHMSRGQALRKARMNKKETQGQVAEFLDLCAPTISNWETHATVGPNLYKAEIGDHHWEKILRLYPEISNWDVRPG